MKTHACVNISLSLSVYIYMKAEGLYIYRFITPRYFENEPIVQSKHLEVYGEKLTRLMKQGEKKYFELCKLYQNILLISSCSFCL